MPSRATWGVGGGGKTSGLNVTHRKEVWMPSLCRGQWVALPQVILAGVFSLFEASRCAFVQECHWTHILSYLNKIKLPRVSVSLCRSSLAIGGTSEPLDWSVFSGEFENNDSKLASQLATLLMCSLPFSPYFQQDVPMG